jgi:hypothetical protein
VPVVRSLAELTGWLGLRSADSEEDSADGTSDGTTDGTTDGTSGSTPDAPDLGRARAAR